MASGISVCMAVKNGEAYIFEQIQSILPQLAGDDELIISDDHSRDHTVDIIKSFGDSRIRLIVNSRSGLISNFENALLAARGAYIFLADQDDVWMPDKIRITMEFLKDFDLVVSDCKIVNENLELTRESFYDLNHSGRGLLHNFFKNSYMGCCMAFHSKVLTKALPFPAKIPMHDMWLGWIAEIYFNVKFVDQPLLYHRRHSHNASTTSQASSASVTNKLLQRFRLLKDIFSLSYAP